MASQANATVETLRKLHRIHRQLNDLKDRQQRGPRVTRAHQANVERLEGELEAMKKEALALRMATDDKQTQLASGEASLEKRRAQLQGASSNREFQALQDDVAAAQKVNEVLEVEILEALEKLDDYAKRLEQAEAAVAKGREEAESVAVETREAEPLIHAETERLRAELQECEGELPAEFREMYRRVTRQKGEDALAPVQGEFCGGCNQHVPVNLINEMMLNRPAVCKACGRLLYLPEDYSPK